MSAKLRVIPIGGLGEIGKNMTAIQYDDEIIIIDCGIMFPENDMLGIDYIIPDYSYVRENSDKVKAILFTHGHEDHVGAVSHLIRDINVPIYATPLTTGLLENKLREAKLLSQVTIHVIQAGDILNLTDNFKVEPFHMAHSIPDCVGFGITTPVGLIVHSGDYKFDHTPVDGWPPDFAKLAEFSQRGVLCLLSDSTNAERSGWTRSETAITEALDEVFADAPGRIIVATFASLISRIQQVANAAYKHGRKMAVVGRSMRDNVKMAREMGYLDIPDNLLVDIDDTKSLPPSKVVVMATGSQGEPTSVIGRLAYGRSRRLSVEANDTVVISAHTIPGNEETVTRIINRLFQLGANVLYEDIIDVHVSGHASREEMKLLINLIRPRFMIPIHGELRHLTQHARMAYELGIPEENVAVVENGTIVELDENEMNILDRLPGGYVYVDGAGVGDVTRRVLRDRERLADSGFFVAAVTTKGTQVVGTPEFISRGFLNLEQDVFDGVEEAIRKVVKSHGNKAKERLKQLVEEGINRYLYSETGKRPMVFVVLK
ncbi:MAG: ribonuclease J [Ardenticatenaceae bacterium]|nr:ribonuclease J [Ardenticatenaceae bacterium]